MADSSFAVLKNVLIPKKDNFVQPADIYFGETIEKIKPHSNKLYDIQDVIGASAGIKFVKLKNGESKRNLKIYDGEFKLLLPGGIDAHVHFNTPGFEEREDFDHGSFAAASGGTTTVIDMPCTSIPAVTNIDNLETKLKALKKHSVVDYAFYAGLSADHFTNPIEVKKNIKDLIKAGVAGIKVYTISSMDSFPALSYLQIKSIAEILSKFDLPLLVHAEDKEMIEFRVKRAKHFGQNNWEAFTAARDVQAESEAVLQMIDISKETGCQIHIVHVSSGLALMHIKDAQRRKVKISAETCPHYLYFTQKDFLNRKISNYLKTTPPVKDNDDCEALWKGMSDGSIKFVTTDHAGCDPKKEKKFRDFWKVYSGIPGVEHRVPFIISEGVMKNKLTLENAVKLLSTNPAEFYHITKKGKLVKNYYADFTLIDLKNSFKVKSELMNAKGKYTPFEGKVFDCIIDETFVRGVNVFSQKKKLKAKLDHGKFVTVKR